MSKMDLKANDVDVIIDVFDKVKSDFEMFMADTIRVEEGLDLSVVLRIGTLVQKIYYSIERIKMDLTGEKQRLIDFSVVNSDAAMKDLFVLLKHNMNVTVFPDLSKEDLWLEEQ